MIISWSAMVVNTAHCRLWYMIKSPWSLGKIVRNRMEMEDSKVGILAAITRTHLNTPILILYTGKMQSNSWNLFLKDSISLSPTWELISSIQLLMTGWLIQLRWGQVNHYII